MFRCSPRKLPRCRATHRLFFLKGGLFIKITLTIRVMSLILAIQQKLSQALPGAKIEIIDHTANHIEHNPVGVHLEVQITYTGFAGKSLMEQHRLINDLLAEELKSGQIHALRIKTKVS